MGSRFFRHQIPELARSGRCIALDFRGHGRSEKTAGRHTVAEYAKDVHEFLAGRKLDDALIVGWSMGALVLWEYLKNFGPERLSGAVVAGSGRLRFQVDPG
jgi:non-heme chloroperoxidase